MSVTNAKKKKRKAIKKLSFYTYLIYAILTVILFFVIKGLGIFPSKYLNVILVIFALGLFIWGFIALMPKIKSNLKKLQALVCILLSILSIVCCILFPSYGGKIAKAFVKIPDEGNMNIDVYVLSDSSYSSIEDLAGKKVGLQTKVDLDYQNYAVKVVNKEIEGNDINVVQYSDIYELVDKLYSGEVDAILLNEDYAKIVADNPDYKDFTERCNSLYVCTQKITLTSSTSGVSSITTQPFIIAISGNDEWDYSSIDPTNRGRTDVNMVAVVNPVTKQVLIVTIPRDSYVYLPSRGYDKLTHASLYGIDCWTDALKTILNLNEINYYFRVNFQSVVTIVDAIGGVDVDNPYYFTSSYCLRWNEEKQTAYAEMQEYQEGKIHLDGPGALGYVRERYSLPDGDIGRNKHQAIFLKACIDKLCSVQTITNISKLLDALQGTFITDLDYNEDILPLAQMQLNDMADWTITTYSITGYGDYRQCYSLDSDEYSVEILYDDSVTTAINYIQQILKGETITEN